MEQGSLRHVEIVFNDPWSLSDATWKDMTFAKTMTPAVCRVSGYVVCESEAQIIIASMIHPEVEDISLLSCVPRGCIVEIKELP